MASLPLNVQPLDLVITPLPSADKLTDYLELIDTPPDAINILEEMSRRHLDHLASVKECRVCGVDKPRSDFGKHSHSHDGFDSRCRECKNREARLRAAYKREHPTPPPGECPMCHKYTDSWVLDHAHDTDEMRGYICGNCNLGLGHFDDDPEFLERAAAWVRQGGPATDRQPLPTRIPRHLL